MISQKLQDIINEQINKELFSEYLYLSMAAYAKSADLDGISNFFSVQSQEEHFHAMKFYDFLIERDGKVVLKPIDGPQIDFKSVIEVFEKTLEHEKYVTASINNIMNLAIKENDHSVVSFLKWFIDEQVEEEASVSRILNRLNMTGGSGPALLMLDSELAKRTFTPPVNTG